MNSNETKLQSLIIGMRSAYKRNENAMEWARKNVTNDLNTHLSTLIAYDLQAGSYISYALDNPNWIKEWSSQLSFNLKQYLETGDTLLEVGVGEATTLAGVIQSLDVKNILPMGFDISFSRITCAQRWLNSNKIEAKTFVGDLFHIPLANNSIDVIYTSHSLEPNGGKELQALKELLRVARKAVILFEPVYELANEEAKLRMLKHGYVRNLKETLESLNANITEYKLLDICSNKLNPSGIIAVTKSNISPKKIDENIWQCPMTGSAMDIDNDVYYAQEVGIAYPIIRGIPLLRQEHCFLASNLNG